MKFFIFCLLLSFSFSVAAEVRMIFDEGISWTGDRKKISKMLKHIKAAGFNSVAPFVWHGRGAIWNSKVAPLWYENKELARKDSLKLLIDLAASEGIDVYPVFTIMLRQHSFYEEFTSDTEKKHVFNVHNDDFKNFITHVIMEVISDYNVDGVVLDYVRAAQVCYDRPCREKYMQYSGRDLMADLALLKSNSNEAYLSISNWQRKEVTGLVSNISKEIRKVKPAITIAVAAAPWAESVVIEGQDSIAWLNDGIVDMVLSMNYERQIDWQKMQSIKDKVSGNTGLVIMVGNYNEIKGGAGVRPRSGATMLELVKEARAFNKNKNYSVYLYSQLTEDQAASLRCVVEHCY